MDIGIEIKILLFVIGVIIFIEIVLRGKFMGKNKLSKKKKNKKISSKGKSPLGRNANTGTTKVSQEKKKSTTWKRRLLHIFLVMVGIGFLFVVGLFLYYAKDLPSPDKINKRIITESTKIYDRTGEKLLYEVHGEERRTIIAVEKIPDSVKFATIVLEDQKFHSHLGVDIQGIMRAALKDVAKGSAAQGGSTITQQFVKNSILTSEKKFSRKIKEVILAIEIEQLFTKEEILGMYLNEIPYGSNAYGVEAAAQTFFGVSAGDMTLAQSSLIATLPKAPTYYSPHGSNTDRLLARWQHSLNEMARLGYITKEQAEEAKKEDILSQIKPFKADIKAPHFVLYIKEKLVEVFGEEEVEKGGFRVYTTLDWGLQEIAEKAVREGVTKHGSRYKFTNAALVATNPKNGQILAMVGSKDYFDEEIDGNVNVTMRLRQPGSSFKPYVYAQAFREGYTPETYLFDVKTNFGKDGSGDYYRPQNYDGTYRGPVKMRDALARSLNVPAVKALYLAGVEDSVELAQDMGIKSLDDPKRLGLSVVLGGGEVRLLDHVSAFGVFANQGIKHDQIAILKIEDAEGNLMAEYEEQDGEQVLEKNVALQVTDILSQDKYRAPAFGAGSDLVVPGVQVAAKTGTTNEYRDGWLVGAMPSLAAGVWAGNNDNTAMALGAAGVMVAGPIWNQFMREATENYQKEAFGKPEKDKAGKPILDGKMDFVEKIDICKDGKDYCLPDGKSCPDDYDEDEKKMFVGHTILYYIDKDDPRGDRPKSPKNDPQFRKWEEGVLKWAEDHADDKGRDIAPDDKCD